MKKHYLLSVILGFGIALLIYHPLCSASSCNSAVAERSNLLPSLISDDSESIYVPNVFTPNGDGINDVLVIYTRGITSFSLEIFDRWGQLEFSSSYPAICWDGRTNGGMKVSDGVYYYIIKAVSESGKDMNRNGTINVLGSRKGSN